MKTYGIKKERIKDKKLIETLKDLSLKSRNLHNTVVYILRQIKNHKENIPDYQDLIKSNFIGKFDLRKRMCELNQFDFRELNSSVSANIIYGVYDEFKSFFALLKKAEKGKKYHVPGFAKDKYKTGYKSYLIFQAGHDVKEKDGVLYFPNKTNIQSRKAVVSKVDGKLKQIRVVCKNNKEYWFYHFYEKEMEDSKELDYTKYLGIDVGVNNLFTCYSTDDDKFIVNGRILKSINQYWNKKAAEAHSDVGSKGCSKKLSDLHNKRNDRIEHLSHCYSKHIIDYCLKNHIGNIVIGKNDGWKQKVNLGKKTNQNFVCIPHAKIIDMIKYQCEQTGIKFDTIQESHTSKCDALALEEIKHQEIYLGKRVKRGVFESSKGVRINADINGAINILRKKIGDEFVKDIDLKKINNVRMEDVKI